LISCSHLVADSHSDRTAIKWQYELFINEASGLCASHPEYPLGAHDRSLEWCPNAQMLTPFHRWRDFSLSPNTRVSLSHSLLLPRSHVVIVSSARAVHPFERVFARCVLLTDASYLDQTANPLPAPEQLLLPNGAISQLTTTLAPTLRSLLVGAKLICL